MSSLVNLILTISVAVVLAFASRNFTFKNRLGEESERVDIFVVLIILTLSVFSGLRTGYNDTLHYIQAFNEAENIGAFLANSSNLDLLHNPLFYLFTSFVRTLTPNYHIFLMISSIFTCSLMVWFIRKVTDRTEFPLSILLFCTLGTYVFTMAAIKQALAMAILCPAILALRDRKYLRFYLLVALAMLVHTYAAVLAILPFFTSKPWRGRSYLVIVFSILLMVTFESSITRLLEYADALGKNIADFEVFDGHRMNIFRIAVYSVVPVATLVFRRRLEPVMGRTQQILINMSIFSLAFMLPGMISGANLFGRVATYFELGSVCVMPWVIDNIFERRSATILKWFCAFCFIGFFLYDVRDFGQDFTSITLREFLAKL